MTRACLAFATITVLAVMQLGAVGCIAQAPAVPPEALEHGRPVADPSPPIVSGESSGFMIEWKESASDASFVLVIQPRQLILRTVSETPDPTHVFWLRAISEGQFQSISKVLSERRVPSFRAHDEPGTWRWSGYSVFTFDAPVLLEVNDDRPGDESNVEFWSAMYANLILVLHELNRGLDLGVPPVVLPSSKFVTQRRRSEIMR